MCCHLEYSSKVLDERSYGFSLTLESMVCKDTKLAISTEPHTSENHTSAQGCGSFSTLFKLLWNGQVQYALERSEALEVAVHGERKLLCTLKSSPHTTLASVPELHAACQSIGGCEANYRCYAIRVIFRVGTLYLY